MAHDPLNDVFNMDPEKLKEDAKYIESVDVPDDPDLQFIIQCALDVYKKQIEVIQYMKAEHRQGCLELAERYLNQAKDAIYKKKQLELNKEKLELQKQQKSKKDVPDAPKETGKVVSRKQLLTEITKQAKSG